MATIPEREAHMVMTASQIAPQCTRLYIALNGYARVPKALYALPNVVPQLTGEGQPLPDKGAVGKFYGRPSGDAYYLTVDDDI